MYGLKCLIFGTVSVFFSIFIYGLIKFSGGKISSAKDFAVLSTIIGSIFALNYAIIFHIKIYMLVGALIGVFFIFCEGFPKKFLELPFRFLSGIFAVVFIPLIISIVYYNLDKLDAEEDD